MNSNNGDDDNEKDVLKSTTQAARKKKSDCSQYRSQTYDLLVTSQDALPLANRKLAVHVTNILRNRHQQVDSSPTNNQGHLTSIFGKYLFGRRFEI